MRFFVVALIFAIGLVHSARSGDDGDNPMPPRSLASGDDDNVETPGFWSRLFGSSPSLAASGGAQAGANTGAGRASGSNGMPPMVPPMGQGMPGMMPGMDQLPPFIQKMVAYYMSDPNMARERACFAKLNATSAIEFVIDMAPSPSSDPVLRRQLSSPIVQTIMGMLGGGRGGEGKDGGMGMGMGMMMNDATVVYIHAISEFIDQVTMDIKPEQTVAVIMDMKDKYFIRGRAVNGSASANASMPTSSASSSSTASTSGKLLNPKNTNSSRGGPLAMFQKNNLGRLVQLALDARDNGLPVLLNGTRPLNTVVYRVVLTDGASGLAASDLTDDKSKTTIVDFGDRRFINKLTASDMRSFFNVLSVDHPITFASIIDTIRASACALLA